MSHKETEFYVVIERDEDGRDVIALCLTEEPDYSPSEFVGVQRVTA